MNNDPTMIPNYDQLPMRVRRAIERTQERLKSQENLNPTVTLPPGFENMPFPIQRRMLDQLEAEQRMAQNQSKVD